MKTTAILVASLLLTQIPLQPITALPSPDTRIVQEDILTPQEVQQTAKNITVRISSENNGGSGVIIAQKGNNYLILTNAHVVRRATKIEIQAPDGQKYKATPLDGGFDAKYDLALLQFTSRTKYTLPDLSGISSSPIDPSRIIYSAGFPFDTRDIRITKGQVSQLSDIPFDDGTQIGYVTDKGEKGIRQGMSGGAIFDARGVFLGINTVGVAPILPDYTYNDGSKPLAKLKAQYTRANWGIPVYNFLTNVKADILYGYANLPKVERQVTPTGYLAKLNIKARQMTVRIENSGGNGSGVIVAKEGNSYYVLTAKHVLQSPKTSQKYTNHQIITYDQDRRGVTSTVVAEGVDLAVVKFESDNKYPVAQLAEYSQKGGDIVFVGGFPDRGKINSPLWQWQFNPGLVSDKEQGKLQTQTNQSFSNGYDLIYSSISYGGMSGGPVFDSAGNVIGIHGRAESTDLNSLGISIQTFTGLLDKLRVNSSLLQIVKTNPFDLNPQQRQNVIETMRNIPQPQPVDNGERWLAYGNQLFRTRQPDKAILAFDRAIAKGQRLLGNYGKAISLFNNKQERLAESIVDRAIVEILPGQDSKYYYIYKDKSIFLTASEKYDEAIKAINIAIQLEPKDLNLQNEKANILMKKKQYTAVMYIMDRIISESPQSYLYVNRGIAKYELGNNQEAIADYDRAISLNPTFASAYYHRSLAKYALGNNHGAIIDYDRTISINSKYYAAYINRGNAKFEIDSIQEAFSDYDRAIAIEPKFAGAYVVRCNAKSKIGNNQEAIIDCDRAIAINPKFAEAYVVRGNAKSKIGNNQEAIIDYNRATAINPKFAEAYFNRGNVKSNIGNNYEAIIDYDRAISLNSKLAKVFYARGNAKFKIGNNLGAIADYDRAIAIDPKLAEVYVNRGNAKSNIGNNQEAIIDCDRAIAINPKLAEAYFNRGNAKSNIGKKLEAIIDYDRAIAIDPKLAEAYFNRGNVKSETGNNQEAIFDYDLAISLNPKLTRAFYSRGNAKFALRNTQEAISDYERAIFLNAKYAEAYLGRGLTKFVLGNTQEAITDYDRAVALNPKFAEAHGNRGIAKYKLGDKQGAITDTSKAAELFRQQGRMDLYQQAIGFLKQLQSN